MDIVGHRGPGTRVRSAAKAWLVPAIFVLCALAPWPGHAENLDLLSVGVRARVGEKKVLGEEQKESFHAYDVVASVRLPWEHYSPSGWGVGSRLLASAGILEGAGKNALVVSAIPVLAFGRQDGRFTADLGAGLALISKHHYGRQDFGGFTHFALTFGVGVPLYRRVGLGYRFLHYSDAGAYGSHTIGADFHMVELSFRF